MTEHSPSIETTPADLVWRIANKERPDAPQTAEELIAFIESIESPFDMIPEPERKELFDMLEQGERTRRQATTDSLHKSFG